MKVLALILLFALAAAAPFHETVDAAAEELADSLVQEIRLSSVVTSWLTEGDDDDEGEKTKEEVEKKLKKILDDVLEKIKDAVDSGKKVKETFLQKLKEIQEKIKELNIGTGEKQKEILEKIKERFKDYFKDLLEKLGFNKRSADDRIMRSEIKELLKKLRKLLKDNIDIEVLKQKIIEFFGEGTQIVHELLQTLKEKGKNKLKILLDLMLDDDDDDDDEGTTHRRSISDMWEKVKDYFKNLQIDLQEKYMKFGEWVKNNFKEGLENSKNKLDNIRAIAREFLKHTKGVSKEIAGEAQEFLRQYKDDLGDLWEEIKEKVKEVYERKD